MHIKSSRRLNEITFRVVIFRFSRFFVIRLWHIFDRKINQHIATPNKSKPKNNESPSKLSEPDRSLESGSGFADACDFFTSAAARFPLLLVCVLNLQKAKAAELGTPFLVPERKTDDPFYIFARLTFLFQRQRLDTIHREHLAVAVLDDPVLWGGIACASLRRLGL